MRRIAHPGGEPVPSWSWMAYSGAIDYVSAPGGQISWSHDVKSPFSARSSGASREHDMTALALETPVRSLVKDLPKWPKFVFFDSPTQVLEKPVECVALGCGSPWPSEEFQVHWVILVRCISASTGPSFDGVYERVGVAILEARHIDFQGQVKKGKIR